MKLEMGLFLALSGLTSVVHAQSDQPLQRWEVGGEFGISEHSLSYASEDQKIDEQDTVFRVFGSYYFTPQVALRVGYADLGEVEWYNDSYYDQYTSSRIDELSASSHSTAYTFGGVFSLPINQMPVTFALELGFLNWTVDHEATEVRTPDGGNTVSNRATYSSSDLGFYGGVSVNYQITQHFALGVAAQWYAIEPEIDDNDQFDLVVQTLNLNTVIRF